MRYDVFAMCNALFDIQAEVDDSVLTELGLLRGSMSLVDEERQREVVSRIYTHVVHTEAGGSGANTAIGAALLGCRACYTSRVGDDEHGALYRQGLFDRGVQPNLGIGAGDTGISLILITPDTQRTMLTFLGQSRELCREDVVAADVRASKFLYATAYLWDTDNQKEAVLHAMHTAKEADVKVALSLSDPFCVGRHREDLLGLIREHVDVLFGNFAEAQELTATGSPRDAVRALSAFCDVAVVTMDDKGSLIHHHGRLVDVPAYAVHAVDTTGAGDMYAAGLLYGLCRGLSAEAMGHVAAYSAAQVVAKLGPRLEEIDRERIEEIEERYSGA